MARVNCYLPDDMKAAVERIEPPVNLSKILRLGVAAELRQRGPGEPEPAAEGPR